MEQRPSFLPKTWYDPRLSLRPSSMHGTGLFATELIREGETVMIWGGTLYREEELPHLKLEGNWSYSMVDENLYLFAPAEEMDYFINHSCDPTVWVAGEATLMARRDIQPGEEITGDYAVWEGSPDYVLEPCQCGSSLCRGQITGNDWQHPDLQARYAGHFLPYLGRRIARLTDFNTLHWIIRAGAAWRIGDH